jgi:hypothetical protein
MREFFGPKALNLPRRTIFGQGVQYALPCR